MNPQLKPISIRIAVSTRGIEPISYPPAVFPTGTEPTLPRPAVFQSAAGRGNVGFKQLPGTEVDTDVGSGRLPDTATTVDLGSRRSPPLGKKRKGLARNKKSGRPIGRPPAIHGAGYGVRTRDLHLGKVARYQLR